MIWISAWVANEEIKNREGTKITGAEPAADPALAPAIDPAIDPANDLLVESAGLGLAKVFKGSVDSRR
ncbi:hypothetical protein [Onishia taeanensis]